MVWYAMGWYSMVWDCIHFFSFSGSRLLTRGLLLLLSASSFSSSFLSSRVSLLGSYLSVERNNIYNEDILHIFIAPPLFTFSPPHHIVSFHSPGVPQDIGFPRDLQRKIRFEDIYRQKLSVECRWNSRGTAYKLYTL